MENESTEPFDYEVAEQKLSGYANNSGRTNHYLVRVPLLHLC